MPYDYSHIEFDRPAPQIKSKDVPTIPQRIIDGMKMYEDAARGFDARGFEREIKESSVDAGIFVSHRPESEQVAQIYRMPRDPKKQDDIERLTYFDIGSGRTINTFRPILGEDWRGVWRAGGAIIAMDLNGNENFQLWRYWEETDSKTVFPKIEGELNNSPGKGRIERITHDEFKYGNVVVSHSNKFFAFASNKGNNQDTHVYMSNLRDSKMSASLNSNRFSLPSRLVTAPRTEKTKGTIYWTIWSISTDDSTALLGAVIGSTYIPMYLVDLTGSDPIEPELLVLPGATERENQTVYHEPQFSQNPDTPNLLYVYTDAYGDFTSLVTYDIKTRTVIHITTPELSLSPLRPIPWGVDDLLVTRDIVYFTANVQGWDSFFCVPLVGAQKDKVIEIKPDWPGGRISYSSNKNNDRPFELVIKLITYKSRGYLAHLDLLTQLDSVEKDTKTGEWVLHVKTEAYTQAAAPLPPFKTWPPELIRFPSFDGLEVPVMYYHPKDRKEVVPLVIQIHGGPESQSTSQTRLPIHWYLMNELGWAVMYPNVRGSSGYGKKYMAADDVEKREDSVKDIGALLSHIKAHMPNEIDSSRVAVTGGSYGGYMVYASLTHFSDKLTCGLANFGIGHWPSFLENTAPRRRDHRRKEYGDESNPEVRAFLERISPLNNADKISIPLSIAHGETDSRVPVEEAVRMWEILKKNGVHCELMVCEKEGHGFKQKSVIEFTNAAKVLFLERYLSPKSAL